MNPRRGRGELRLQVSDHKDRWYSHVGWSIVQDGRAIFTRKKEGEEEEEEQEEKNIGDQTCVGARPSAPS